MIITGYDRAQKSFRSGESQITGSAFQILHGKLSLSFEILAGLFPKPHGILTRLLSKRITEALAFLLRLRENTVRLPVRLSQNLLVLSHQLFCVKTRLLSFFKRLAYRRLALFQNPKQRLPGQLAQHGQQNDERDDGPD